MISKSEGRIVAMTTGLGAFICGLLAHIADVLTCYTVGPFHFVTFRTSDDILQFEKTAQLLMGKSAEHLALGQFFAMTFIPLMGIFGSVHLFAMLDGRYVSLAVRGIIAGYAMLVATYGTVMHTFFTVIGLAIGQFPDSLMSGAQPALNASSDGIMFMFMLKPYFEMVAQITIRYMMPAALLTVAVLTLFGYTHWPRWFVVCNPGIIQGAMYVAGLYTGPEYVAVRVYLIVVAYNLSMALFYGLSAAVVICGFDTLSVTQGVKPVVRSQKKVS